MARKRGCKYGRSTRTGKCKKAPKNKWARAEREWDAKSPKWRSYGEPQSHHNPWGGLGRMSSRRRRRSRR